MITGPQIHLVPSGYIICTMRETEVVSGVVLLEVHEQLSEPYGSLEAAEKDLVFYRDDEDENYWYWYNLQLEEEMARARAVLDRL